jgi:hypothetical protein
MAARAASTCRRGRPRDLNGGPLHARNERRVVDLAVVLVVQLRVLLVEAARSRAHHPSTTVHRVDRKARDGRGTRHHEGRTAAAGTSGSSTGVVGCNSGL